jgi:hypothetical protein
MVDTYAYVRGVPGLVFLPRAENKGGKLKKMEGIQKYKQLPVD